MPTLTSYPYVGVCSVLLCCALRPSLAGMHGGRSHFIHAAATATATAWPALPQT
jgi:hypothetical protein